MTDTWTVEIDKRAPRGLAPPSGEPPIDLTDRVTQDGFGTINRAVERDLLSFRTGDLTIRFDDGDGFVEDLLDGLAVDERWTLAIHRRGELMFQGVILGPGSIEIDRKLSNVTLTAYGPTRILVDSSAESVARTFGALTVTTATAGLDTLDINDTAGLLTGDVLHITNQVDKEDVTVRQRESATRVKLDAVLANSYASGSPVTVETPYYRDKGVQFLIEQLFAAAQVPIAEILLNNSQFRKLAPSPVNSEGLTVTGDLRRAGASHAAGVGALAGKVLFTKADDFAGPFSQIDPDDAWVDEAHPSPRYVPIDLSPYIEQGDPEPDPQLFAFGLVGNGETPHIMGYEHAAGAGTKTRYLYDPIPANQNDLMKQTSTDGWTWSAPTTFVATFPEAGGGDDDAAYGCELDPDRQLVYVQQENAGVLHSQVYDLGATAWTDLAQAGDGAYRYVGFKRIKDLDIVLSIRADDMDGPFSQIAAWRGTQLLWLRPFPNFKVEGDSPTDAIKRKYPTQNMRYINGSLYTVLVNDGAIQFLRSDDEFQTYVMHKLVDNTTNKNLHAGRVGDTYRIYSYRGSNPDGHFVAAPFYAGVIEYADFEGLSVAEALQQISVITNAVFWIDDDLQGHFVARGLAPAGDVLDISDRVMTREEMPAWDETVQRVIVSGAAGAEASAGDAAFGQETIEITSPFVTNEALAQALAEDFREFFSKKRPLIEGDLIDVDGHIYYPMQRVILDGLRYMIYSSDHARTDQVHVQLLQDLENP